MFHLTALQKQAYSKYTENFTNKKWKISDKNSDIFHISAPNIECGYSQSMFLSRNKNNNVYPCKPQFYYIKWGLMESTLYRYVFMTVLSSMNMTSITKHYYKVREPIFVKVHESKLSKLQSCFDS